MSNILIVLAHPNPESLNASVASQLKEKLVADGHDVRSKNVCTMNFESELSGKDFEKWGNGEVPSDVKSEQEDISWADGLAFIFPTWWNDRPAALKGWMDRTLTKGFAYDFTEQGLDGKLAGKKAFVATTAGSPEAVYDYLGISKDHLHEQTTRGTLGFCGITDTKMVITYGILAREEAPKEHLEKAVSEGVAFFKV